MYKCNLRILMAKKKIDSITDLMNISHLSRNAIDKVYKEIKLETVSLETFTKLCDALDCTLSELIEYIPEKKAE